VLLVVGILALLAAIVAPRLIGTQRRAYIDTAKSQIAMLDDVLELYYQQNGCYPTTEQGLQALMVKPEDPPIPRNWAGPYLEEGELVDPWGSPYQYAYPGEHNTDKPDIWSLGPDGEDGTEDDIGNWIAGTEEGEEGLMKEEQPEEPLKEQPFEQPTRQPGMGQPGMGQPRTGRSGFGQPGLNQPTRELPSTRPSTTRFPTGGQRP